MIFHMFIRHDRLRLHLMNEPVMLALPSCAKPFILDTDASMVALGAVLQQHNDGGQLSVVSYASRILSETEQRWTTRELEAYAIVWAVLHFKEYLQCGVPFTVRTDHESLAWIWKSTNKRILRWSMVLQEFTFKIVYRAGRQQQHVDILTRDVVEDADESYVVDRVSTPTIFMAESEPNVTTDLRELTIPRLVDFAKAVEAEQQLNPTSLVWDKVRFVEGAYVTVHEKLYVPQVYRDHLITYFHHSKVGAHIGIGKVYNRMKIHFWWPDMKRDIPCRLEKCFCCLRRRPFGVPRSDMGNLNTCMPSEVVAIDLFGPIVFRQREYTLLTMIDHYSKFAEVIDVTKMTVAQQVWDVVYQRWICVVAYIFLPTPLIF